MNENNVSEPNHVKSNIKHRSSSKVPKGLIYTLIILCICIAWTTPTRHSFTKYMRPATHIQTAVSRLPHVLEHLAAVNAFMAVIPAVEIVTDADSRLPRIAHQPSTINGEKTVRPEGSITNTLPNTFTISEEQSDNASSATAARIKILQDKAEAAFQHGTYKKAVRLFSEWHQLEPTNPLPLTRIGDALINQGYNEEASLFYHHSLNIAPEQINLAMRQANLLSSLNHKEASKDLLNSYSYLFPDNINILFAQAEWLYKQNLNAEAKMRIERILAIDSDNFTASLFLLRLAYDEPSLSLAIDHLMALNTTPEHNYEIVNAVRQYDLLTIPNSHFLLTILDDIDHTSSDQRTKAIIRKLRPRTKQITERFDNNQISKAWQIDGASSSITDRKLTIQANSDRKEFTARLLRTERWRDNFFEIDIDNINGGLWIYTRRSQNHLIRFGFDESSDYIYLQVLKGRNNNIIINRFIPWTKPKGSFKMRMEAKGNGISASIDGKQLFDVPITIPNNFGPGWSAFSVNTGKCGIGAATIASIKAGPLPTHLAMLPTTTDKKNIERELQKLRKQLAYMTDFSPDWFSVDKNGNWNSQTDIDNGLFRLFSRYYRIRLIPTVKIANGAKVLPEDIITVTRIHNFDGLVLRFETMPSEKWFIRMNRNLGTAGIDLIVVSIDKNSGKASMRGIGAGRTLLQQTGAINEVPLINFNNNTTKKLKTNETSILLF